MLETTATLIRRQCSTHPKSAAKALPRISRSGTSLLLPLPAQGNGFLIVNVGAHRYAASRIDPVSSDVGVGSISAKSRAELP